MTASTHERQASARERQRSAVALLARVWCAPQDRDDLAPEEAP
ncbi:hypothetical protein HNR12_002189 [Streptomonospora nanhaiensis]|uniref:Uncharacterized protein n=1 Tax=Streptomonospora nanhaiensis TaxID=1323731 RepID=A0A853BN80_9ACTN|nr:hypothetical protein [Streptomonospora nanhaiensis]NYI95912.1 hypothetical protein [Streptomonospora nanhaiensis]